MDLNHQIKYISHKNIIVIGILLIFIIIAINFVIIFLFSLFIQIALQGLIQLSTVIGHIKGSSSFAIKGEFQKEIKKRYWKTGNIWAVGFFVASVGEVNDEIVSKYVESQGKKENEVTEIEL